MELLSFIQQYKDKVINIALIILALIIASNIYQCQTGTLESLIQEKDLAIKKSAVLADIGQLEETASVYKNSLNKKDVSSVVNTLSSIALDSGVKITSLKPEGEQKSPAYIKYSFNLTITADNYHAIGKFINKLENHPDIYIMETTNINKEARTNKLSAALKISTLLFRD